MTVKKITAAFLEHGMTIIDPEGNVATVVRLQRVDHERGRLETDLGVAIVSLDDVFQLA